MQVFGVQGVARGRVVLSHIEGVEKAVEVLHVRDVTAEADDSAGVEGAESVDGGETGEGSIGGW